MIVSTHPRTHKRIERPGAKFHPTVRLLKPLGLLITYRLQKIGARGAFGQRHDQRRSRRSSNFPALNIREAHERPEGMEEAAVMMIGLDSSG